MRMIHRMVHDIIDTRGKKLLKHLLPKGLRMELAREE